jgi:heme-degrading monooxygenase HmoA
VSQGYHLAQINVGRFLAPIDSPQIKDFVDNLDRINALAESQPGFVWRLVGEGNNATDVRPFEDPDMALNLSVWESLETLAAFVYRTAHRDIMRRRREWFSVMETYMTLWWVPVGYTPTPEEGWARLKLLEQMGPTADAFTFRNPFPAPDAIVPELPILDRCA